MEQYKIRSVESIVYGIPAGTTTAPTMGWTSWYMFSGRCGRRQSIFGGHLCGDRLDREGNVSIYENDADWGGLIKRQYAVQEMGKSSQHWAQNEIWRLRLARRTEMSPLAGKNQDGVREQEMGD